MKSPAPLHSDGGRRTSKCPYSSRTAPAVALILFLLAFLSHSSRSVLRLHGRTTPGCSSSSPPLPPIDASAADLSFLPLSYLTPDFFPFPRVPLVMETAPGTCDLFWDRPSVRPNPCDDFSQRNIWEPDPHVREVIASALHHCRWGPCRSLDVGANIGYMVAFMASLGSHVVAVEPQKELAGALLQSVSLNGWQDRVLVLPGLATVVAGESGTRPFSGGFRLGRRKEGGLWDAPLIRVQEVLLSSFGAAKEPCSTPTTRAGTGVASWDLVKLDTDSVDIEILDGILALVEQGAVSVSSFAIESVSAGQLHRLVMRLGYTCYRLNVLLWQRHFDGRGKDVRANFSSIPLPPWVETEVYQQRYIRYALKLRAMETEEDYAAAGKELHWYCTTLAFEEPSFEYPGPKGSLGEEGGGV
jgi:hypothetical protein